VTDLARLGFDVDTGGLREGQRELRGLSGQSDRTTSSVSKLGGAIRALAGALAIGAAFRAVIRNTIEQERVTAQLDQTLRSTGRYTEELSQGLQDYASALQNVTTFGDEAIIASQSLLLTFTQIGEEAFPRAQEAVLNVATAMGTDLKSAAVQVGKALNDPILGLTALSRSGITFSESQKDIIKQMVEVGDVAGAQSMILDELETQFGGSARAARDTLGGALQSLSNTFGDLLEGKQGNGGVSGATKGIKELTAVLNNPEVQDGFTALVEGALKLVAVFAEATASVVGFTKFIAEEFAVAVGGIAGDDIDRLNGKLLELEQTLRILDGPIQTSITAKKQVEAEIVAIKERIKLAKEMQAMAESQNALSLPNITVPRLDRAEEPTGPTEGSIKAQSDLEDQLARRRDALRQSLESERETERRIFGERDAEISALEDVRLITEMEAANLRVQNEREMYRRIDELREENLRKESEAAALRQEQALSSSASIVSITTAQVNQMSGLFEEAGGIGKAFFVLSQGLAAANSIIQGIQAGMAIRVAYAQMAAMAGPAAPGILAAGEIHAGVATSMGFVAAGMIGAQTVASFDGGGFTGMGPRSGGMDGKGGFLAMMHPNETVTDHTKGQGQGVVVNINNAPQGTRAESRQGSDGQQVIEVFVADMNNGGPMSKTMQSTFGMRRQGR
jgi:hypothetical protein